MEEELSVREGCPGPLDRHTVHVYEGMLSVCRIPSFCDYVHMCRSSSSPLLERARRVFNSLAPLSIHQLVPMARALVLPVTMGIAR